MAYRLISYNTVIDPVNSGLFENSFGKQTRRVGEEALMLAMLGDAIECFLKYFLANRASERKLFQEAEEWIWEKGSDWVFSFENVCHTLGLDPDYIRHGLLCSVEGRRKPRSRRLQVHRAA